MDKDQYIHTFCRFAAILASGDPEAEIILAILKTNPGVSDLVAMNLKAEEVAASECA